MLAAGVRRIRSDPRLSRMTSRRPGAHPAALPVNPPAEKHPIPNCARGPWSAVIPLTPTSQPRRLVSALQPWLPCRSVSPFPWSAPSRARRATCAPRRFPPARPVSPLVSPPAPCSASTGVPCAALASSSASANRANPRVPWTPSRSRNASGARLPGSGFDRTPTRRSIPQISPAD